jgi:hypothetical protein
MMKLTELRRQTGEPTTQLLHEAVAAYYRTLVVDHQNQSVSTNQSSSEQLTGDA